MSMSPLDSSEHPSHRSSASVTLDDEALLSQCQIRFTRSGGPGGQHRNKVSTAVELTHVPSGTIARASERRSQAENRSVAIARLRIELALNIRDDVTDCAERLVPLYGGPRLRVSTSNDDFPIVLADIINRIERENGQIESAATFWKTTISQIVRLLRQQPSALQWVNHLRNRHQLHPLR